MDFTQRIADLVASNPGQMTAEEYSAIVDELLTRGPCAFLVFGLGRDTPLWCEVNKNGRTCFLEHDPRWLRVPTHDARPPHEVVRVEYRTRMADVDFLKGADPGTLAMVLPERVRQTKWDVVLVDGPPGDGPGRPGRFQSIYEASRLAAPDARVFVHDVHRPVEKWFSRRFLGQPIEVNHHLGTFGTKAKHPRR